jgi:hypothetical protein
MATDAASRPRVMGGGKRGVRAGEEELKRNEMAVPEMMRARESEGSSQDP